MPRKIRQLLKDYKKAGFYHLKGQDHGDHKKFRHPNLTITVIVDGQDGDDARRYQEKQLQEALAELKKAQ